MYEIYFLAQEGKLIGDAESGPVQLSREALKTFSPVATYALDTEGSRRFGLAVLAADKPLPVAEPAGLRAMLAGCPDEERLSLLSRAAQIAVWHRDYVFCPRCGNELQVSDTELAKVCRPCEHHHYPRINPCIIVLVRRGTSCLLAHASRFANGRYSLLAGFIEAGESAEDTVRREVREEVGIEVTNIRYVCSQSWPFPHSLMLGFFADYLEGDIREDGDEIVHADWFEATDFPILPPGFTIARRLIDQFIKETGAEVVQDSALFFPTE